MLIKKKVGEVTAFKLISGEEIIGKIAKMEGKSSIEVERPLRLQMQPDPSGQGVMPMLAPFIIATPVEDLTIELRAVDIMVTTIPDPGLVAQYNGAVSQVIQANKPQLIV